MLTGSPEALTPGIVKNRMGKYQKKSNFPKDLDHFLQKIAQNITRRCSRVKRKLGMLGFGARETNKKALARCALGLS